MPSDSHYSSVKVIIRVRPLVKSENLTKQIVEVQSDNKTLKIYHGEINKIESKFDHVIPHDKMQINVFEIFSPYMSKIFDGYNLTIFAYGQTGSGKTYTMFGKDWESLVEGSIQAKKQNTYFNELQNDTNFAGLIPRSIHSVFDIFQQNPLKYQLFCSFLQIYNEKVFDLLQNSPQPKPLTIHQSKTNGIFVEGLIEFQVQRFQDCIELMRKGQKNRFIRQTSMNAKSSRSHTIFQILVESEQKDKMGNPIRARLNLCDLAGSEKVNKTENMGPEHMQELKNINLSLTTLGKVISSLSNNGSKKNNQNIASFRQSKLTRLLQQSLTSNTNTFVIGNISPSQKNFDETLNTLKFAQRAHHVTMKIKPIEIAQQQNQQSVDKLKKQINYLKELLNQKRNGMNQNIMTSQLQYLQGENQKLKNEAVSATEYEKVMEENRKMKHQIHQLAENLQKVKEQATEKSRTHRSRLSSFSSDYHSSDYSAKEELRQDIYLEKFVNKAKEIKNREIEAQFDIPNGRQRRGGVSGGNNNSVLLNAAKLTIDHQNHLKENQNEEEGNVVMLLSKQQKNGILDRMQKMEEKKNRNDSLVMEELEQLHYRAPRRLQNKNSQSIDVSSLRGGHEVQKSKKNHQANVFRKPKRMAQRGNAVLMSMDEISLMQNPSYKPNNPKKVDYGNKIKELEMRLYKK